MKRRLKMGMIGGGSGGFIGGVHRMAAYLDDRIDLVAGVFSSDRKRSEESGQEYFLSSSRCYGSFAEMARCEAALPEGERIDFVSIVVPNNLHYEVSRTFLEHGIHVVCEKPATLTLKEAKLLRTVVDRTKLVYALTHNYTGYPMVKEAKEMVERGRLGRILKVVVEYQQGKLAKEIEVGGKQVSRWRDDPKISGASFCMGDIGTHAENLVRYVTGLEIDSLCADLHTFIPGGELDDDGNVLLRFTDGARGLLYATKIANGEENRLHLRVYGAKGSLTWSQEDPNELILKQTDVPARVYRRGNGYISSVARANSRLPFGHPEGFIEAFANVYVAIADAISDRLSGRKARHGYDFPNIDDAVKGMAFLDAVLKSGGSGQKWQKL